MTTKHIVGIGGAHVDWIAKMCGQSPAGASTPGQVESFVGGGCLNSLRALAQLLDDHKITIISARGGDPAGEQVQLAIEEAGIEDQSAVFLDRQTPTYTAILNSDGNVVAAVAGMALYEDALPRHLDRREVQNTLENADVLIIDTNLPSRSIEQTVSKFQGMVIGLAISPAKSNRLASVAEHLDGAFMNRSEQTMLGDLGALGFNNAVVTNSNNDVVLHQNGTAMRIAVPKCCTLVDATGAGDALAGATIAAMIRNPQRELRQAVKIGIGAAREAIKVRGPTTKLDWNALAMQANQHDN